MGIFGSYAMNLSAFSDPILWLGECVDGETVLVLHPDVPWIAETDLRQNSV